MHYSKPSSPFISLWTLNAQVSDSSDEDLSRGQRKTAENDVASQGLAHPPFQM